MKWFLDRRGAFFQVEVFPANNVFSVSTNNVLKEPQCHHHAITRKQNRFTYHNPTPCTPRSACLPSSVSHMLTAVLTCLLQHPYHAYGNPYSTPPNPPAVHTALVTIHTETLTAVLA